MAEKIAFAELVSRMAHELRSPLTSVKGFSATLMTHWDRFSDDQRQEFVTAIHDDAERMGRIIAEVLDIARTETGRLELNRTRVDLRKLCMKVGERLGSTPGGERIVVDVPEGLSVLADEDRIGRILHNLVENGVRFSEERPVRVTAQALETGDVLIAVSDEGVGIEEERIPEVFEGPGPRGQMVTPRGTGLGLYLGKRLIEAHGGTISAESEAGKGSTFRVQIPGNAP
jgi:signal transduction histidine kinase